MATESEQPHTQPGDRPGEAAAEKQSIVRQIVEASINYLVIFSALGTIVVLIFTWAALGTSDLVKAFVTVGLAGLIVALTCCGKLKQEEQLSIVVGIAVVSIGVTCVCATTVVVLHFHRAQPSSPISSASSKSAAMRAITIKFVQRGTPANPIAVGCQQVVPVSGRIPKGYDFAVGNVIAGRNTGNAAPVFVPQTAAVVGHEKSTWQVPVTFGHNSDAGHKFMVYLEVMPKQELNYLVKEGQQTRLIEAEQMLTGAAQNSAKQQAVAQSWWIATGLPSSPAFTVDTQIYQRSSARTGCPK